MPVHMSITASSTLKYCSKGFGYPDNGFLSFIKLLESILLVQTFNMFLA